MRRDEQFAGGSRDVTGQKDAQVWLGPAVPPKVLDAVVAAGGSLQTSINDANVIIWCGENFDDAEGELLRGLLHPGIEWVQLDGAGVDDWFRRGVIDRERSWTSADYGPAVAEQVLGFLLAACRRFPHYARTTQWGCPDCVGGVNLADQTVGFLGAGRIVAESVKRLRPFGASILTVSDPVVKLEGVDSAYGPEQLAELLGASDHVVVVLPLTEHTRGMIGVKALEKMRPTAWLHNVGRGQVVDTSALVAALSSHQIAGACLDTTDPEPLPDDHLLWQLGNVLLTQHTANPDSNSETMYAGCVGRNVMSFLKGGELAGIIDIGRGY